MIEKWEIIGYRRLYITENDPSQDTWVQITTREFDEYPTDEQKETFCKDYNLDKIAVRKVEICVFK